MNLIVILLLPLMVQEHQSFVDLIQMANLCMKIALLKINLYLQVICSVMKQVHCLSLL